MSNAAFNTARPSRKTFPQKRLALAISALLSPALLPSQSLAAPTGGVVTTGAANIVQSGSVTNINQSSHKATINWHSFSTAASETVNFNQPNAASVTLNRVIGNEQSVLNGALNATGQVFLLNSNGVLIGKGASINTAGFVASTLGLSDADFNNGQYRFQNNGSPGALINLGTITIKDGGYAALLGQSVTNQGVIVANKGTVSLNSGNRMTLNFNGDSLLSVSIDEGSLNALVENKQAIQADGGKVILTAKAAGELLNSQVNNAGVIQAQTLDDITGAIELFAYGGTATVNGTLDASAPVSGNGGFIETSGETVKIADGAIITTYAQNGQTGTWLIDPTDFTIGNGGDMTGEQLSNRLATNHIKIESITGKQQGKGDIHVNDDVSWSSNTTLTLNAENDIYINNALTIKGENGELVMNTGGDYHIRTKASYSGAVLDANGRPVAKQDTSRGIYGSITFTNANNKNGLTINNDTYTLIHSMDELAQISGIRGHYALANNLEGGTHTKAVVDVLDGTFTGLGHVIDNLKITIPETQRIKAGLIGETIAGVLIRDIGLTNVEIIGNRRDIGALVGYNRGTVHGSYSTGSVKGLQDMGGLIGTNMNGAITSSFSFVDITSVGGSSIGGLVGWMRGGSMSNVHADGAITAGTDTTRRASNIGGLVGTFNNAPLSNAYATTTIQAGGQATKIGGLIGSNNSTEPANIRNVFASGSVSGSDELGGLIGALVNTNRTAVMSLDNAFATGDVTASGINSISTGLGGLIGRVDLGFTRNDYAFTITNVYAVGRVTDNRTTGDFTGGLIGQLSAAKLENAWASGNVTGSKTGRLVGGLIGNTRNSFLNNVQAYGDVSGNTSVGGLVGQLTHSMGLRSDVVNAQAYGDVIGNGTIGGLAGSNSGTISQSFSMGKVVNGGEYKGGLTGYNTGVIRSSFFNAEVNTNLNIVGNDNYGSVEGSLGLGTEQFADIQYYLNGTIDAVLADRAATTARTLALQARMVAAGQQTDNLVQKQHASANRQITSLALAPIIPTIDSQFAIFSTPQKFSAEIKSFESDGKQFDLH